MGESFEFQTLTELLSYAAKEYPDSKAIEYGDFTISYKDLLSTVKNVAANLRRAGLSKGSKIAIMLPNSPQGIISLWGVLFASMTVVNTNPMYTEDEITYQFSDAKVDAVISCLDFYPKLQNVLRSLSIKKCFLTFSHQGVNYLTDLIGESNAADIFKEKGIYPYADLLMNNDFETETILSEDIAMLQYTGGTTGVPKGCMLTHRNLTANAEQAVMLLSSNYEKGREKILGVLPYFHIYGMTTSILVAVRMAASMIPVTRFEPHEVLGIIQKHAPTVMPSAPSVFLALVYQKDISNYDLSSIKICVSGSAPISEMIRDAFEKKTKSIIVEGYGLSETSPLTHVNPVFGEKKIGSVGLPVPFTETKIMDVETGLKELDTMEVGEIVIKGPQVMKGYYNKPEDTAAVLKEGWLYTGDIGYKDKDNYLFITDRKKDLIISAGFNVYPREIETVLSEHPAVLEVAVIGSKSKTRGEIVQAFIVLAPNACAEKEDIVAFAAEHLAHYKIPKRIEFVGELPKTPLGKVLKRKLS